MSIKNSLQAKRARKKENKEHEAYSFPDKISMWFKIKSAGFTRYNMILAPFTKHGK